MGSWKIRLLGEVQSVEIQYLWSPGRIRTLRNWGGGHSCDIWAKNLVVFCPSSRSMRLTDLFEEEMSGNNGIEIGTEQAVIIHCDGYVNCHLNKS